MDLGLQGKHAIVVGGSRGIGKAIAQELAREGVDVAIAARTKEPLEQAARELAAETGRRVIPLPADVTSREQVDRMVAEAARQLGGLHILVNSGSYPGGTATGPIDTLKDEDLLTDFDVKYMNWACPQRRRNGATSPLTHHGGMPSAAWWMRRKSPS